MWGYKNSGFNELECTFCHEKIFYEGNDDFQQCISRFFSKK